MASFKWLDFDLPRDIKIAELKRSLLGTVNFYAILDPLPAYALDPRRGNTQREST